MPQTRLDNSSSSLVKNEKDAVPAEIPQPQQDNCIDHGLRPWLQVLAGHLLAFNSWGYATSYGLFQAYYTSRLNKPPSTISWIGSIQLFLVFFLSTFSTHALTTGYYRPTLAVGLILQIVGIFTTAQCKQLWQFFLAQGLCQGIGMGLVFAPTVGLVGSYFEKKRALSMGAMASGMSSGGIIFPFIAQQMLGPVGFEWTIRTMGFIIIFNSVVAFALVRPKTRRHEKPVTTQIIDYDALRDRTFLLFAIGMVLAVLGMWFSYYYTTPFAESILHADSSTSLSLLLTLNALGIPGRLLPAYLADRFLGPMNTLTLIVLISSLLTLAWAGVDSINGMWAWAAFYGLFSASVQSLFPPALAVLTPQASKSKVHVRVGMMFTVLSAGCLGGPPMAGALIQVDNGRYLYAQMIMGSIMLLGFVVLVVSRTTYTRSKVVVKC